MVTDRHNHLVDNGMLGRISTIAGSGLDATDFQDVQKRMSRSTHPFVRCAKRPLPCSLLFPVTILTPSLVCCISFRPAGSCTAASEMQQMDSE
jgi:hypothetical protein